MEKRKLLVGKIIDYKNYTQILLALSTFFYFGIVIKGPDLTTAKSALLLTAMILFILFAYLFQKARKKYEEQLAETE
ncbi:YrhC family protein [Fervidibacillus albus]|uniref:YrhC family protein n=1 Tax=Fervidibacillus albus TaxID=2980026 RepID=A0A9E8LVL8_9BACI|nr:YrhC family protein [Fervidibacillus albus]WAA10297.1 YrhC family protein [Fervidibacillus albus]